jgi:hypothetical protein
MSMTGSAAHHPLHSISLISKRDCTALFYAAFAFARDLPSTTPKISDSFMMIRSSPSIIDFSARPFSKQHAVTDLDVERNDLACLVACAGTDSQYFSFDWFLLCGIRDDDAAASPFLGLHASDQNAIM